MRFKPGFPAHLIVDSWRQKQAWMSTAGQVSWDDLSWRDIQAGLLGLVTRRHYELVTQALAV